MQVKHLLLIVILAPTAACSLSKETVGENPSESQPYQQTQGGLNNKNYNSIVTKLRVLESRYPSGRYTEQAQLELIYANYKNMESEAARAATKRFARLRPQYPNVDHVYYLKSLSSSDQDRGLPARFLPLDMTKRGPDVARNSFDEFIQLISRFPNGRYAPDTKVHTVYLRNLLAAYEVHVGHHYLKYQAYVAAANHSRYAVEDFQETPVVGDGLAITVETYRRLGLGGLASTSLETLKLNYPDNASLKDGESVAHGSRVDTHFWLAKATLGLIEGGEPSPHMEAQVTKGVIKRYEDAEQEIPAELKPENQDYNAGDEKPESDDDEDSGRSWWSYMTSGLSD